MEQTTSRFYAFLPWILTLAVLVAFTLYGTIYKVGPNPFEAKVIKGDLLSTMRIHLLEAIEAEKNAVLAITDDESEDFAAKARHATDNVEKNRKEMEAIILQDKLPQETEMINEFNSCWSQYRKLDETILALAVQNTNLKAQKVSSTQCNQEMARFEDSLGNLIHRKTNNRQCNNAVMLSYEALTASLKIFALHKPHIEEANDQAMDNIEQNIKSYDETAKKALNSLHNIPGLSENLDLNNADAAYKRFMTLTGEVLRLSRLNTNIKSVELSLGKKRLIASQCQENLASLQEAVQAQQSKATR